MRGENEYVTALREIVHKAELGSRCGCCNAPHVVIERPGNSSRVGFTPTTHKVGCVIGELRKIAGIPDEEFA